MNDGYQRRRRERNMRGLCWRCDRPLGPNSRTTCQYHLEMQRAIYWNSVREYKWGSRAEIRAMWDAMDWSKSDEQIAKETGRSVLHVQHKRRQYAKVHPPANGGGK